mmetsp:Transcript_31254/g.72889  ORF Transcript_31254/g.72889 Transcript_31254/m.72889 type:complete len:142 (+) Transcript_31254:1259-1684(+)
MTPFPILLGFIWQCDAEARSDYLLRILDLLDGIGSEACPRAKAPGTLPPVRWTAGPCGTSAVDTFLSQAPPKRAPKLVYLLCFACFGRDGKSQLIPVPIARPFAGPFARPVAALPWNFKLIDQFQQIDFLHPGGRLSRLPT